MSPFEIDHSIFQTLLKLDECKRANDTAIRLPNTGQAKRAEEAVSTIFKHYRALLNQQLSWQPTN